MKVLKRAGFDIEGHSIEYIEGEGMRGVLEHRKAEREIRAVLTLRPHQNLRRSD